MPSSPSATASPHVAGQPPRLPRLALDHATPLTPSSDTEARSIQKKEEKELPPLVLRVAIRPGRMTVLTIFSIGSIIALVLLLHRGREVGRVAERMTPQEKSELLDKYNSYAGNVGAVFGKPIELFVTAAVQVLVLRFLTRLLLRPQPDRRVQLFALALSTGVGYLIGNGFNAINVQFHDLPVQPVITPSDLTGEVDFTYSIYASRTTTVNVSAPETARKNPSTNTVLRSLLLPREPKPVPQCDWFATQKQFRAHVPDDVVQFGMPQRDWMKTLLPQALDAQTLRVIVNATDASANKNVSAADLPMPARCAANLYLHAAFLSSQYLPWGKNRVWGDELVDETVVQRALRTRSRTVSTAVLSGLLPADPAASEMDQRDWFLRSSAPLLSKLFANGTANMSRTDIKMEFSHTQVAPAITFDAVTFDVDVAAALYTTATARNGTRYYALTPQQCAPWRGRCLIDKHDAPPFAGLQSDTLYDAPMQIHAYAVCLDDKGSEKMLSRVGTTISDFNVVDCATTSNSSMLLVSVGKRLRADALLENTVVNDKNELVAGAGAVAVNLTKTYSFTVGRLGWTLEDLAKVYGAECSEYTDSCMGLSVDLQEEMGEFNGTQVSLSGNPEQKLIVGADALPMELLLRLYMQHGVQQRPMSLVQIDEPPRKTHPDYTTIAGDILYPHNVHRFEWKNTSRPANDTNCSAHQEDRVGLVLNNHMYIESTRQATYTAAMFFLFQLGVPRRVIPLGDKAQTLKFDGNVHEVALWLSIPLDNTVLTISGCVVLAVALFVALLWSLFCRFTKRPDLLTCITTPHVIARAMLDESQFPSLLLHRRVMDTSDGFVQRTIAAFEIRSLLLQNQKNTEQRVAASA